MMGRLKMKFKTVDRSMMEEFLAAANFIAGALCWIGGIHWLAWVLFIKAGLDWLCALFFAVSSNIAEAKKELKGGQP
jgi:hypothetical protein